MNSAKIIRYGKLFRSSKLEFSTSFSNRYEFFDNQGFKLNKGKETIFSTDSACEYPFYKGRSTRQEGELIRQYPFTIVIPGYCDVFIAKPSGTFLVKKWSVMIGNKELGVIQQTTSFIPWQEVYSIDINSNEEKEVDLMLFVFMCMFDKLTSFLGT